MKKAKVKRVIRANHNLDVFVLLDNGKVYTALASSRFAPNQTFFLEVGDEVEYEDVSENTVTIKKVNWQS